MWVGPISTHQAKPRGRKANLHMLNAQYGVVLGLIGQNGEDSPMGCMHGWGCAPRPRVKSSDCLTTCIIRDFKYYEEIPY